MRLDLYLVEKKLTQSRQRAQGLISAGLVYVDGKKAVKASQEVGEESNIEIKGNDLKYVGRGGLKLEKALDEFKIDVKGKVCADIGASTGGFTDCLLQRGAAKVFAIDVGYGQLDWKLRNDPRVVVMERVNARELNQNFFSFNQEEYKKNNENISKDVEGVPRCPAGLLGMTKVSIELIVIDVSFISLKKILPVAYDILEANGTVVALIKPQFEVGKGEVGKGGIVRDEEKRKRVVGDISDFAVSLGFGIIGVIESPITGADGNVEFLIYLIKKLRNKKLRN